jgi:hypothetical protein
MDPLMHALVAKGHEMYDYDRRTASLSKTARPLMTPADGEQWEWPAINERIWDEESVQADAFRDVHVMRYVAYGLAGVPKLTIDTRPWFHDDRPEFLFTIEVFDSKVDAGKFKHDDYSREIPKLLSRAQQLSEREAGAQAKKLETLKVPNWEIYYDADADDLIVDYKAPGRSEFSDSNMSGSFYTPLKIFTGGKSDYDMSYSKGADYAGHFGKKNLSGQVRSIDDIKKVLKDAEALWTKAEKRAS